MSLAYKEHYSIKDYETWEGGWELIYGKPYAMSPSPGISHQRLEKKVLLQLDNALKECAQCEVPSEVDWIISSDTIIYSHM